RCIGRAAGLTFSFKLRTSYFALQRRDSSPPLVLRLRGLGLARFGSLGLIPLGFTRLSGWKLSWLYTEV
ncbi:MAG: hypothetical protein NTY15_00030, partial [Planctomycetota bacterium]|nr:hypothetical protein [Planctomycetota bacterium]